MVDDGRQGQCSRRPGVDDAVDALQSIQVFRICLDDQTEEEVAAVELLVVGRCFEGLCGHMPSNVGDAKTLRSTLAGICLVVDKTA